MSLVVARGLGRWYGQAVGIGVLDLVLEPGIVGLLGSNGAGKTTLMRLISGELRPSRGELEVLGERPFANRRLHRELGWAPLSDALYDDLSALAFVSLLARLHGYSRSEARTRAGDALERVGLGEARDRKLGGYSKGMRQRARLAQAIVHQPRLLVVDEPLTGLDPVARRSTLELFRSLAAEGKSLIVSSHVLHEVETLTREVVLLNRGRLLARGRIEEIRALLSHRPLRLAVRAREPRRLAQALMAFPDVERLSLDELEGRIEVETRDVVLFEERLTKAAAELACGVRSLEPLDTNLESVFDYLLGGSA